MIQEVILLSILLFIILTSVAALLLWMLFKFIRQDIYLQKLHTNINLLISAGRKIFLGYFCVHKWLTMEKKRKTISSKPCVTAENYNSSGIIEVGTKTGSFTGHANDLLSWQVHCTTCACSVALLCSKWHACQLSCRFALRSSS